MSDAGQCEALIREAGRHFRVAPIEEHQKRGEQVRRVLMFGRGGAPRIAVTFIRSPGQSPKIVATTPAERGGEASTSIETPLSAEEWEEVIERSQHFHRTLAPEPTEMRGIIVCSDGTPVVAEASDPRSPDAYSDAPLRRRAEHDCFGLTEAFENWAADFALARFPECAWLRVHGLAANILAACARFSGDKVAAAQAYNMVREWPELSEPEHLAAFRNHFVLGARLIWNGETVAGDAAEAWLARTSGEDGGSYLHTSAHGESAYRVRTRGILQRWQGDRRWIAPVEMAWETSTVGARVRRVEVGAFKPMGPICTLNIRRLNADPNCR
jgi:hypothetical protein